MKFHILCIFALLPLQLMSAYEKAFPQTDVGKIEIKELPAARLIAAHSDSNYFENNGKLFGALFRYIQANEIAMTTPVKAEIDPGVMYFYIGSDHAETDLPDTDEVTVIEMPKQTVLSIGERGSYNAKNFDQAKQKLLNYLEGQSEWVADGAAQAIYWNGPFTPWFLKRFEVQIPVKPVN